MNYYTENIKLNETLNNQKLIIAKLQRDNDEHIKLIAQLAKKIEAKENVNSVDLLNFD
jgi:mannitol/fructose-specific phosphotransferase system IIA component (Ntr-type)